MYNKYLSEVTLENTGRLVYEWTDLSSADRKD
mgnify:CR=1 FL=1